MKVRVLLTIAAVLTSGLVFAQTSQTGLLQGRVVTAEGVPIAGAAVRVEQLDGSYPKDATSGDDGQFRVSFLPPGFYLVTANADGFMERTLTNIRISAQETSSVVIELISEATEFTGEIVVTAETPLIDTQTSEFSMSLSAEETSVLPSARTANDLVKFTAGGSNQQLWGGSTDQANDYQLDGVTVNSPGYGGSYLLPNVDWIEELQVKGLGAGAEYGNFQGGVINIVTKSGGNETHGGIRLYYEDASLQDTNFNTFETGSELDTAYEVNADIGGAFIRDRLYYFFSAQQIREDTNIVDGINSSPDEVSFLPVQEERTENKLYGKLTWDASVSDRINFVLGYDDLTVDNRNLDSFTDPEAAENQESPAYFFNANWAKTLSSEAFMELKLSGWSGENERLPKNGDLPSVQILGGNREIYNNAIYTRRQEPENIGFDANFDWFVTTGSVNHSFKFGGEYEVGTWLENRSRNGNMTWRPEEGDGPFDPDDPATWGFISSDWGSGIRLDGESINAALYIQDYIDITPSLRLSAGLRYGIWEGELTPGFGEGGSFEAVSDSALEPRLGLVWDLTGEAKWVAKAHWGRYHQSIFALLYDRVIGGDVFQDTEYWDWVGPGLPDVNRIYTEAERETFFEFYDDVPASAEVGPALDYEQPYVDQLVLGLEHAVGRRWRVAVNYVKRENKAIVALEDLNLATNYTEFNNVEVIDFRSGEPVLDGNGNPLILPVLYVSNDDILYVGSAPGLTPDEIDQLTWDQDFVLTNPDQATRDLDQYQLMVDGRGDWWNFSGSLVYTELTGNFFSVSGYQQAAGIGAGPYVYPNELTNYQGRLRNANEWEAKLRFDATLPWTLRAGAYLRFFSGEYYAPIYEIDGRNHDFYAADGSYFDPDLIFAIDGEDVFLEPRGNREYDSSTLLDLHLDKGIPLGGSTELVVGFDVFNVFGNDTVTEVEDLVNTGEFGAVRQREAPRTWRLFAAFRF